MNVPIHISKFSSLSFINEQRAYFDTEVCYCQKFGLEDYLRIQFTTQHQVDYTFNITGANYTYSKTATLLYTNTEEETFVYEITYNFRMLTDAGFYNITISQGEDILKETTIEILEDTELYKTIYVEAINYSNDFGTIFQPYKKFPFRVEGGIYQGEIVQNVENETFRDQRFSSHQLVAYPYEVRVLTIGDSHGVPQWIGNKINWLFAVSQVLIDGKISTRNESSVPELTQLQTYWPLYVYKLNVEQDDESLADTFTYRIFDNTFDYTFN